MELSVKTIVVLATLSVVASLASARSEDAGSELADEANATSLFRNAQMAARSGRYDLAGKRYAALMSAYPENVDYVFGYAQTLFWSGKFNESLSFLKIARQLAPEYEDVWELEFHVRKAIAGDQSDGALEEFLKDAAERFPNSNWPGHKDSRPPSVYRWEIAIMREFLDNDAPDWT